MNALSMIPTVRALNASVELMKSPRPQPAARKVRCWIPFHFMMMSIAARKDQLVVQSCQWFNVHSPYMLWNSSVGIVMSMVSIFESGRNALAYTLSKLCSSSTRTEVEEMSAICSSSTGRWVTDRTKSPYCGAMYLANRATASRDLPRKSTCCENKQGQLAHRSFRSGNEAVPCRFHACKEV